MSGHGLPADVPETAPLIADPGQLRTVSRIIEALKGAVETLRSQLEREHSWSIRPNIESASFRPRSPTPWAPNESQLARRPRCAPNSVGAARGNCCAGCAGLCAVTGNECDKAGQRLSPMLENEDCLR